MIEAPWRWLYRKLGARYLLAYGVFAACAAFVITLGTLGLMSLYTPEPPDAKERFLRVLLVAEACVTISLFVGFLKIRCDVQPLVDWIRGARSERESVEAWRRAVELPLRFVTRSSWNPAVLVALPVSVFAVYEADLPAYSAVILFAGAMIAIIYAAILNFFYSEIALRPLVADITEHLPKEFATERVGVPLRWKLLGALPLINVFTGVVVSGLSTSGNASLEDLGLDVIVAVLVAFTISFELTLLVTKAVLTPVNRLLEATRRVTAGDLSTRVPVLSGDELGALTASFNEMVGGLAEREALRDAFGSYVDPGVAERVLTEGELLEGDEVEVTVVFIDIRDFTAFAERASAAETVQHLNDFFELVVPILTRHGGHANKFVGDGVLGVFGAPERMQDHADRALAAACELASEVERTYGDDLRIGIGINSGLVVAGTVGGGGRLEFTVIGDPVNVAARVEDLTSETGDTIALTEATRCLLGDPDEVPLEPRGEIPLKGKSEPIVIHGVRTLEREGAGPLPESETAAQAGR